MVYVTSASLNFNVIVTLLKKFLDVHPRPDSTEFHGIGRGSSDWLKKRELIALFWLCSSGHVCARYCLCYVSLFFAMHMDLSMICDCCIAYCHANQERQGRNILSTIV